MTPASPWPSPKIVRALLRGIRLVWIDPALGTVAGVQSDSPWIIATHSAVLCLRCSTQLDFPPPPKGMTGPLFPPGTTEHALYVLANCLHPFYGLHVGCSDRTAEGAA